MRHDMVFRRLDGARSLLLEHAHAIGYVCLAELLNRHKCVQLARTDFDEADLAEHMPPLGYTLHEESPAMEATATHGALDGDDDEEEEEEEDDEDVSDAPTQERTSDLADGPGELAEATVDQETARLCAAALIWAQEEVARIVRDRPNGTFKLLLYKRKGGYIASHHFGVENPGYQPPRAPRPERAAPPAHREVAPPARGEVTEPTQPALRPLLPAVSGPAPQAVAPQIVAQPPSVQVVIPPPESPPRSTPAVAVALNGGAQGQLIYLDPDTIPEARVWRALGKATEDFLGRVGATYGNIIELQARTVTHQSEQLDKSQALVENLATQLLVARQASAGDEADQKADEHQIRVREELGKTFLNELGSLGRVLASSKLGVPPELADLGDLISTSPELAEALRDPQVRALLKEEATRKELAKLLTLAAKQPRASGESTPPHAA